MLVPAKAPSLRGLPRPPCGERDAAQRRGGRSVESWADGIVVGTATLCCCGSVLLRAVLWAT